MRRFGAHRVSPWLLAASLGACGGGDGTPPVSVAGVAITAPAGSPSFATLGRTLQFTAQARDAAGAVISGAVIDWTTNSAAVATVSGSGVVTAVGNGTAQITASSGGQASGPVTVTVAQVVAGLTITPGSVALGAIGSTKQLSAFANDSGGAPVPGITLPGFTQGGPGTSATVSQSGLVTAVGVGTSDTAVIGGAKAPITVTQVVATIAVTSTSASPDTLFATGRTRQLSAAALDSNGHPLPAAAFTWTSSANGTATVGTTGLVMAASDGVATIQAASGGRTGSRPVVVRRLAASYSFSPSSASIATNLGTQAFTGSATDSASFSLPLIWASRNLVVVSVSPATGSPVTAMAVSNGTTFVVMSIPAGALDSAAVTTSNQVTPLVSFATQIQPIFNRSCAKVGCHTGTVPQGGMNLSAGVSYNNLVRVTANGVPTLKRVLPGDPDNSYIVIKVEGTDNRLMGNRMPDDAPFTQPYLTPPEILLIRNWILLGAPNN